MLVGKLWPNGEFGIKVVRRSIALGFKKAEPLTDAQEFALSTVSVHGIDAALEFYGGNGTKSLGLSLLSNFTVKSQRGLKGITRMGARKVRNAAFALERESGKNLLTFLTLTLPGLTLEEWSVVARKWSRIVDNLTEGVRRRLKAARLSGEIVGVTEFQGTRLANSGEPGFHLHLLFVGRRNGKSWVIKPEDIDGLWQRIIQNYINRPLNFRSACKLQRVESSASGYLGKYMSKGVKEIAEIRKVLPSLPMPSAWYTISRSLLRRVMSQVVSSAVALSGLWNAAWKGESRLVKYANAVFISARDGREIEIARYGRAAQWYADLFCRGSTSVLEV